MMEDDGNIAERSHGGENVSRSACSPNVLWVFADQLRADALGGYGDPNISTPNLDRLAREGVACGRAYSNYPLCCPFRASLLTGRHSWETGVIGHAYRMRDDIRTVADSFNDAGYRTSYIGKWHLDGQPAGNRAVPGRRGGFSRFKGFELSNRFFDTRVFDEEGRQLDLEPGYQTDILTNLAVEEIERFSADDRPFFMTLSVEPPHSPYQAPDEYMRRFADRELLLRPNVPENMREYALASLRGYYAQVENLDWNIGRLLGALERLGILEDTVVMFFSDHGDMLGSHGLRFKQWPYEESVRIPLIVRYPSRIPRGSTCDSLISNLDFYPTTMALAGIKETPEVAGADVSGLLSGTADNNERKGIAIVDAVATVWNKNLYNDSPWRAYVTQRYKISYRQLEFWELFDLDNDPCEIDNLVDSNDHASIRHDLTMEFIQELFRSGDGFQVPREYLKHALV